MHDFFGCMHAWSTHSPLIFHMAIRTGFGRIVVRMAMYYHPTENISSHKEFTTA